MVDTDIPQLCLYLVGSGKPKFSLSVQDSLCLLLLFAVSMKIAHVPYRNCSIVVRINVLVLRPYCYARKCQREFPIVWLIVEVRLRYFFFIIIIIIYFVAMRGR